MHIAQLDPSKLADARGVLAAACRYDRASEVAAEKLFGAAPQGPPRAFGAWDGERLIGVAAVSERWIRLIAVTPVARGRGVGSALLQSCESVAQSGGHTRLRMLDQPGNYLAPGIDGRNQETIAWLERRGWRRDGEPRCNLVVAVKNNPRISVARAVELAATARSKGCEIRRAAREERAVVDAVRQTFGDAWSFEIDAALSGDPPGVYVALHNGRYCAFAAHDGNNRGLGWFGPAGTWPEFRGKGLGEALLVLSLVDVARDHDHSEIAWIGPRPFYEKVVGVVGERTFTAMVKEPTAPLPYGAGAGIPHSPLGR